MPTNPMILIRPALLALVSLLLGAPGVQAADYAPQIAKLTAACPAIARRDFPTATDAQVQSACACMAPHVTAAVKRLEPATPTLAQWTAMGQDAAASCLEPLGTQVAIAQCSANPDLRRGLKTQAGFSDAQVDRYCGCHVRLSFAEVKAGLNMDDPQSARVMQEKSRKQCLEPIRAGTYRE